MIEFIIAVVVIWIIIKITAAKKDVESSFETGKEVKHIAINELGVPEDEYYRLVVHHMTELKQNAMMMQALPKYRGYSWSRVLAYAIYNKYHDIIF